MESRLEDIKLIIKKYREKFKSKVIEVKTNQIEDFEMDQFEDEMKNYVVEVQAVLGPGFTWLQAMTYKNWDRGVKVIIHFQVSEFFEKIKETYDSNLKLNDLTALQFSLRNHYCSHHSAL
ncbi:uncharacterized protein MELLADRAFT_110736 [Melampsora larici-populina 98AG31]|uniref:Uncharacterized protein n=1 Tax=Melampsora larici-populina (strain 98AG31 / pathotype 3-4-7) TaxID=747676 RepID=F4S0S7_MELLP|nr:uncharacterized protein MELLADRAFT_110736 [Melampsora larici-populina 98AG31]EGG01636.1 hypothetical protein MELLADRAFT_110736 [Melampsora larici-populina 98AG31]